MKWRNRVKLAWAVLRGGYDGYYFIAVGGSKQLVADSPPANITAPYAVGTYTIDTGNVDVMWVNA